MEEIISKYFKSIYEAIKETDPITMEHMTFICFLANSLGYLKDDILGDLDIYNPFCNLTEMSFEDRVKLINEFCGKYSLSYLENIDKINLEKRDKTKVSEMRDGITLGLTSTINGKLESTVPDYGYMLDSTILLHELSHLKDMEVDKTIPLVQLFTEALAFSIELIYVDYLENNGYFEEGIKYKNESIRNFYSIVLNNFNCLCVLAVVADKGTFNRLEYEKLFGEIDDESYEQLINDCLNFIDNIKEELYFLLESIYYTFACFISCYCYKKFKENNNFIYKIEELHNKIKYSSLNDCFECLELSTVYVETFDVLEKSLIDFLNDISEKVNKINGDRKWTK